MNLTSKTLVASATLLLMCFSSDLMAGRGGGGFHGGGGAYHGGGGAYHGGGSFGGGAYHGGGAYEGGGYRGEGMHESPASRSPAANFSHPTYPTSHTNFTPNSGFGAHGNAFAGGGAHPGPGPHPGPHPDWYHGNWNNHGHYPWHNWPAGWWGAGFLAGVGIGDLSAPWAWGYSSYNNPYCSAPVVVGDSSIDYSQPIVLAGTTDPNSDAQTADAGGESPAANAATELLGSARNAFAQGDYENALKQCDKAIAQMPNYTVASEFRGLVLFALHRYKEAAGTIYAVLSVGPGWDWTTMIGFYSDADLYSEQLRALEQYVVSNPNMPEARFLLGYEYMTCGHADAAANQFQVAAKLNPQDQLSAQLAGAIKSSTETDQTVQVATATPPKPVDASAIAGDWKATRADGATISLSLSKDAKYTWKYAQKGKPQEFSGAYTVADDLLILKKGDAPVMVGQVTMLADGQFNFKLPGDNPSDPGLTFGK